jgi:hypothetical protein
MPRRRYIERSRNRLDVGNKRAVNSNESKTKNEKTTPGYKSTYLS